MDDAAVPVRELTAKQAQVARLVARGLSYKQIAAALNVAPRTARAHVQAIAILLPETNWPVYTRVRLWAQVAYPPPTQQAA